MSPENPSCHYLLLLLVVMLLRPSPIPNNKLKATSTICFQMGFKPALLPWWCVAQATVCRPPMAAPLSYLPIMSHTPRVRVRVRHCSYDPGLLSLLPHPTPTRPPPDPDRGPPEEAERTSARARRSESHSFRKIYAGAQGTCHNQSFKAVLSPRGAEAGGPPP